MSKLGKDFNGNSEESHAMLKLDPCSLYLTVCTRQRLKSTALFYFALNCRVLFSSSSFWAYATKHANEPVKESAVLTVNENSKRFI